MHEANQNNNNLTTSLGVEHQHVLHEVMASELLNFF